MKVWQHVNFDDIENIECSVHEQTASQTSDTEIYH
jgi:hypothetical protein